MARLTDQAAVAVELARRFAATTTVTVAHLLAGLAVEPEGRAGRRLRERASAAAELGARAVDAPAPPLEDAVRAAAQHAGERAAGTVDLLDAALTTGGDDIADLLAAAGYDRDLDGWLLTDPVEAWFEDAETYGFDPGDALLEPAAARVIAQVRAVAGGAVEVILAVAAAPDAGVINADPTDLAAIASRLRGDDPRWDAGLDAVLGAAQAMSGGERLGVRDLVRAALAAGGDGPRLIVELAGRGS